MKPEVERRRHRRIVLKGTAILLTEQHAQRGRLINLSEGGLLATTLIPVADALIGHALAIELRLDGPRAEWIRLAGRITRIDGGAVAVSFDDGIPASLGQMMLEMTDAARVRDRTLSVVLVDADTGRRALVAEGFRDVGCELIEAATPLEAIVRLGEASFEPDLIAVGDSVPGAAAEEMRQFVERAHPAVKLVSIGDELVQPASVAHRLSSADPGEDLVQRIRHLLATPRRV